MLTQNQQGDMLYAGVRKQVEEHLARECSEQLVPLFPLDAASAQSAQDVLEHKGKGRDAEIAPVLGLLPDSPGTASTLAGIPAGERFLSTLTAVWDDHCSCMGKLRDVLKYVVRALTHARTASMLRTAMSSRSGTWASTCSATRSSARSASRCRRIWS